MKTIPMILIIFSISICTATSAQFVAPKTSDHTYETVIETIGYYKSVLGDTAKWNPISLKVKMIKSLNGEIYEIVGYKMPFDFGWMDTYYGCTASKVHGELSDKYSFSSYVGGYTVYFNLC
jgi:hypothetical protein